MKLPCLERRLYCHVSESCQSFAWRCEEGDVSVQTSMDRSGLSESFEKAGSPFEVDPTFPGRTGLNFG